MFARNVAIHLKPNTLSEFTRIFDNEVLPILRKQTGFQDEVTLSTTPTGMDVIAISLACWRAPTPRHWHTRSPAVRPRSA